MQPYFFPYVGYFQLIMAVDTFVFYDDVNFIKRGWINRNRIFLNGTDFLITIPCIKASQNNLINEILVDYTSPEIEKLKKILIHAYQSAPNYKVVMDLVIQVLDKKPPSIAELTINSVTSICRYLGVERKFKISSKEDYRNANLKKADRLIDIVQQEGFTDYVNAIGGMEIYTKEYFSDKAVNIEFLKPAIMPYNQKSELFVPGLSIIDLLMFESKETVLSHLRQNTLE